MSMYQSRQDRAIAREADAKAEMDAKQAERRAEYTGSREVGRGLFKDPRRAHVDELVRARLNRQQGHVAPNPLKAAQDKAWAKLEPLVNEIPGRPLSINVVKAVVAAAERGPVSAERGEQLIDFIVAGRTKGYETKADVIAKLERMNAYVAKERPLLNAFCKETGAGDSVPLALELLAESADRG
jgi:hypothetical protein